MCTCVSMRLISLHVCLSSLPNVCVERVGCLGMHLVTSCKICTLCHFPCGDTCHFGWGWRAAASSVAYRSWVCLGMRCRVWELDAWMLYGGVTTYGRHCRRIYIMFLSWGEGALINLQCALQMACVSGRTRTCSIRGSSDSEEGKWHKMTLCTLYGNLKGQTDIEETQTVQSLHFISKPTTFQAAGSLVVNILCIKLH